MTQRVANRAVVEQVIAYRSAHKSGPRDYSPATAAEWMERVKRDRKDYDAMLLERRMRRLLGEEEDNELSD